MSGDHVVDVENVFRDGSEITAEGSLMKIRGPWKCSYGVRGPWNNNDLKGGGLKSFFILNQTINDNVQTTSCIGRLYLHDIQVSFQEI